MAFSVACRALIMAKKPAFLLRRIKNMMAHTAIS